MTARIPDGHHLVCYDYGMGGVWWLIKAGLPDDIREASPNLSEVAITMLLGLLLGSGAVAAEGSLDDARERSLETWSFHDLLFHTRSRRGRHAEPLGATYPFKDSLPPLPAVKPRAAGPCRSSRAR